MKGIILGQMVSIFTLLYMSIKKRKRFFEKQSVSKEKSTVKFSALILQKHTLLYSVKNISEKTSNNPKKKKNLIKNVPSYHDI
jgi:hypothetical protein